MDEDTRIHRIRGTGYHGNNGIRNIHGADGGKEIENMYKLFNEDCLDVFGSQTFLDIIKGRMPIIVTDPPFNIGYHYKSYKDRMNDEQYYEWLDSVLNWTPFVVIHYPESLYKIAFMAGRFPEKVVSWVYNSNTAKQHRDIAFFGVKPDFRQVRQPYKNPNDKRIRKRIQEGHGGGDCTTGGMSTKSRMFQRTRLFILARCLRLSWTTLLGYCRKQTIPSL